MTKPLHESGSGTIIFIGGYGRSGSTLLDRLLGQLDGGFSLGEVRHAWSRSFGDNQLCGCGEPFRDCSFWNRVVDLAFGGFNEIDLDRIQNLRGKVDRVRFAPLLAFPRLRPPSFSVNLEEYLHILQRLYTAVFEVSNSRVLVDSSKDFLQGAMLLNMPETDLHFIQLVRDSRAVAHSWTRKRERPEVQGESANMPRYTVLRSGFEWSYKNLIVEVFRSMSDSNQLLRYEDFVNNPEKTIKDITRCALGEEKVPGKMSGHTVEIGDNHTVSGNPMRFKRGEIEILNDKNWKMRMGSDKKKVVTGVTWPLLKRYGYSLNTK
jgi:hypothetical protein